MAKEIRKTDLFNSTVAQWENQPSISFVDLVSAINGVHQYSHREAVKAVNRYATMRNWLIGFFIVEYQQKGNDRAAYGEKLLKRLEESLDTRGLNVTLFQNSRLFYVLYPQVADLFQIKIQPTALAEFDGTDMQQAIQPTALAEFVTDGYTLVSTLSFAHITDDKSVLEKFIKENEKD